MTHIVCYDLFGNAHTATEENTLFRPASYGIFIENNHILLVQQAKTGLWHPPGAILDESQSPTQIVRTHFRRLMGMVPVVGPLVYVEDQYLYQDEQAWSLSVLYYALSRPTTASSTVAEPTSNLTRAWIDLDELQREKLQFGYEAIRAGQLHLKL